MNELKIGEVLGTSWELTKKHGMLLALMVLGVYFIYYAISYQLMALCGVDEFTAAIMKAAQRNDTKLMLDAYRNMTAEAWPAYVVGSIISIILFTGLQATFLNIAKGKTSKVDFSGYKQAPLTYVKVLCGYILFSLAVGIGTACCVLPGIFIAVKFLFVCLCMLDNPELPFFDAFKKSWEITKSNFWSLLGLGICIFLINLAGTCCCCVGLLLTIPLSCFALAVAYIVLSENYVEEA